MKFGFVQTINHYGKVTSTKRHIHMDDAEDEPTVVFSDGTCEWYKNNVLHREGDRPAVIKPDGSKFWYIRGRQHRESDKPAVETLEYGVYERFGSFYPEQHGAAKALAYVWMRHGVIHRDNNRPAVVHAATHTAFWLRNGKLDRTDGGPTAVKQEALEWHENNELHRDAPRPACMETSGWHSWWTHDTIDRRSQVTNFGNKSCRFAFVCASVVN